MLALIVWAMLVLGVPKVSPLIAEIFYPVEGENVFRLTKQIAVEDVGKEFDQERQELFEKCFEEYGAPESDLHVSPPQTEAGKKVRARYDTEVVPVAYKYQRRIAERVRQIEQDYRNRRNVQLSIAMNLARISPVSCYTYILSGLSGTGVTEPDNFTRNAQRYQDEVEEAVYDKFDVRVGNIGVGDGVEGFDPKTASILDMMYYYPTVMEALEESWLDVLLLSLFDVLFCSVAFMRLSKYDVR